MGDKLVVGISSVFDMDWSTNTKKDIDAVWGANIQLFGLKTETNGTNTWGTRNDPYLVQVQKVLNGDLPWNVEIPLTEDLVAAINGGERPGLWIDGGCYTLTSVKLVQEVEVSANAIWTAPGGFQVSWNDGITLSAEKFADASVGDYMTVNVTAV